MKSSLSSEYIRIGRTVSIGEMPVCLGAGEHFDGALQACLTLANTSTGPCKPAWSWRTLRRGPASLLGAGEDFDEALQACLTLANTSTRPCKPAWGWRTLRRGPASLFGAGEHFDEALQACLELIYGKSNPNFLAPTETGGESRKIRQPAYPGSIIRPLPGPYVGAYAIRPYPGYQEKLGRHS